MTNQCELCGYPATHKTLCEECHIGSELIKQREQKMSNKQKEQYKFALHDHECVWCKRKTQHLSTHVLQEDNTYRPMILKCQICSITGRK